MRWIKHLTTAHLDESVTPVLHDSGPEAYGVYWLLCEIVAASMDKSERTAVKHPISFWRANLYINRQKLLRLLQLLCKFGLISYTLSGEMLEVSIPNLLKYRDEYASRVGRESGHARDKLPPVNTDTDIQTETDKEIKKKTAAAPPLVVDLCAKLRSQHPKLRRDTPAEVSKKLKAIFTDVPKATWDSLVEQISAEHDAMCKTDQWQREGGRYAKGLCNWIAANADRWRGKEQAFEPPELVNGPIHAFDVPDYSSGPPPDSPLIIRGDE